MRASSRSSRFVCLCIEGKPTEESETRRAGGGLGSPVAVVAGVLPVSYLPPPGKGKGKISKIRCPCGSEYLRAAVRYADAVGLDSCHSRVIQNQQNLYPKFLLLP